MAEKPATVRAGRHTVEISRPDKVLFPDDGLTKADPPDDDFAPVRAAAAATRELLDDLGLASTVMTAGSRGLHVIVPLDRHASPTTRGRTRRNAGTGSPPHAGSWTSCARTPDPDTRPGDG
ncbi:hypothetical protein GCM10023205_37560 [Yinghuangia aomiensis]|uniref:DNA ligase D polymerase domain-containing protein n=1 Tax=Yinghuangia aomiensis TaxID=676205 RepID=A0ABP9HE57_9ACTN